MSNKISFVLFVIIISLLFGCTNKLNVSGNFPKPILRPMPIEAGLYLDETFKQYRFEDTQEDREEWRIFLGPAQTQLLSTITQEMFEERKLLDRLPSADTPAPEHLDLILTAELKTFQYTMPRETSVDIYEVWLKYNFQALDYRGETLADWIVTAYGKTPSAFLKSNEEAMNQAIVMALRDLGASFSLRFARTPELRKWLSQHQRSIISSKTSSSSTIVSTNETSEKSPSKTGVAQP